MSEFGRGTGRTRTWDVARPRGITWASGATFGDAREILSRWFATDTAAGRLLPWLPIAFGFGVVLYFTAAREPSLWASLPLACVLAVATFFARARPVAFPILLGVTAVSIGFATAALRSARIAHPILQHTAWNIA